MGVGCFVVVEGLKERVLDHGIILQILYFLKTVHLAGHRVSLPYAYGTLLFCKSVRDIIIDFLTSIT